MIVAVCNMLDSLLFCLSNTIFYFDKLHSTLNIAASIMACSWLVAFIPFQIILKPSSQSCHFTLQIHNFNWFEISNFT